MEAGEHFLGPILGVGGVDRDLPLGLRFGDVGAGFEPVRLAWVGAQIGGPGTGREQQRAERSRVEDPMDWW